MGYKVSNPFPAALAGVPAPTGAFSFSYRIGTTSRNDRQRTNRAWLHNRCLRRLPTEEIIEYAEIDQVLCPNANTRNFTRPNQPAQRSLRDCGIRVCLPKESRRFVDCSHFPQAPAASFANSSMILKIIRFSSAGNSLRIFLERLLSAIPMTSATCQRNTPFPAAARRIS